MAKAKGLSNLKTVRAWFIKMRLPPRLAALAFAVACLFTGRVVHAGALQSMTAHVNGAIVHYLRAGSGPPVLLIHGYPESSDTWRKVAISLAAHYTVIAPDTRGAGSSSMKRPYTSLAIAEDLRLLMRQLGFRRVYVVGHDFGVQAAAAYALLERGNTRALVVMESPLAGFGLEDYYGKIWQFTFFMSKYPELLLPGHERAFFEAFAFHDNVWNRDAFTQTDIDRYVDEQLRPGRIGVGFAYYRALPIDAHFFREHAPPLWEFPVLAIDGDHSFRGATAASFRHVARRVGTVLAPQCGHFIQEERPAFLSAQLMAFFGAHP